MFHDYKCSSREFSSPAICRSCIEKTLIDGFTDGVLQCIDEPKPDFVTGGTAHGREVAEGVTRAPGSLAFQCLGAF